MPITTDFEIQSDSDIRYIGAAHGVSGAGLQRWALSARAFA